jgi:hypothetical protein
MKIFILTVFDPDTRRDVPHAAFDSLDNAKEYAEVRCKLSYYSLYEMELIHLDRGPYMIGARLKLGPHAPLLRNDNPKD